MVMALFNIVQNLSSWFEDCQCHEELLQQHASKHRRSSRKEMFMCGPYASCPMKGKRAPELASGALNRVFDELVSMRKASLLRSMAEQHLDQEGHALVLHDFDAGRNYIQLGLQVKLDFWNKLPWRLAALGHNDTQVARTAAHEILETCEGLGVADPFLVHHPTTLKFLHPTNPLRQMVQAFAEGENMSSELQREASKLAFMPVVERSIESKHSLISRRVQKHWRSGRIVSLTLRVPDIKSEMLADASFLQSITQAFSLTRDPVKAAQQLGIHEHPALVDACFKGMHKARRTGILNRIVYRCDLESKFERYEQARREHEQEKGKRARLAERAMKQIAEAPEVPAQPPRTARECYEAMLRLAIEDHFVKIATSAASSQIYSLDLAPNNSGSLPSLKPLDAVLEQVAGVVHRSDLPAITSDIAESENENEANHVLRFQGCEVVHFQVIHAAPSHMHTVPMARASGRRLRKGEMAVSVHSLHDQGDADRHVSLEPVRQGRTCVAVLSDVAAGDIDVLQETFTQFQVGQLACKIKDFVSQRSQSCDRAITKLVRDGAFPEADACSQVALEDGVPPLEWRELETAGLVTGAVVEQGTAKAYSLTPVAVASLEVVAKLCAPRLVCEPREHLPLADCTIYELVRKLESAGWTWQQLPSKPKDRRSLCHDGSTMTWYSTSALPNPFYLQCLLDADRLRDLGVLSIPHYSAKPAATYKQLLSGQPADCRVRARLQLTDDVDDAWETLESPSFAG